VTVAPVNDSLAASGTEKRATDADGAGSGRMTAQMRRPPAITPASTHGIVSSPSDGDPRYGG